MSRTEKKGNFPDHRKKALQCNIGPALALTEVFISQARTAIVPQLNTVYVRATLLRLKFIQLDFQANNQCAEIQGRTVHNVKAFATGLYCYIAITIVCTDWPPCQRSF